MQMLRLRGGRALSPFRLGKLTSALKTDASEVSHISAEYWYFCATAGQLREEEVAILEKLLKCAPDGCLVPAGELFLVVPRPGTISAQIYACAKEGMRTIEIARTLGRKRSTVSVHLSKIKHPERPTLVLSQRPLARSLFQATVMLQI